MYVKLINQSSKPSVYIKHNIYSSLLLSIYLQNLFDIHIILFGILQHQSSFCFSFLFQFNNLYCQKNKTLSYVGSSIKSFQVKKFVINNEVWINLKVLLFIYIYYIYVAHNTMNEWVYVKVVREISKYWWIWHRKRGKRDRNIEVEDANHIDVCCESLFFMCLITWPSGHIDRWSILIPKKMLKENVTLSIIIGILKLLWTFFLVTTKSWWNINKLNK